MGSTTQSRLFQPITVGPNKLAQRIAMAPLTRFRADDDHVPLPFVAEYYEQRASVPGTLLITEATFISPQAGGYGNVPGIYNDAQIAAWKKVTDAVHAKGSYIWLQLWALGRTADPNQLKKEGAGELVSASNIPYSDKSATPRPLTESEIQSYVVEYATAAANAVHKAGFDGVEIHGANGYLVDQFLQDTSNQRDDKWGGSIENRSRFALEVSKAVVEKVGADRTAIRLSPWSEFQGMKMKEPLPQFSHVLENLKKLDLAYVHLVESRVSGNADKETAESNEPLLEIWGKEKPAFVAGGYTPENAKEAVDGHYKGYNVVVVFGRHFIPNPDLVFRIKNNIPLTKYDRNTFYDAKNPKGYIDWAFSKEWEAQKPAAKV